MATYKLKKGYNIKIIGSPSDIISELKDTSKFALTVADFIGIKPKLSVAVGDKVKAGSCLLVDKKNLRVNFCSPISGVVSEIRRGNRRSLQEIIIEADGKNESLNFSKIDSNDLLNTSRKIILEQILTAGLFPFFIQRPYAVIAKPEIIPKNIFITAYHTAPLSPNVNLIIEGNEAAFQAGINAISRLTEGVVYLSIPAKGKISEGLEKVDNATVNYFSGAHPAGNVGIQAHHIAPVSKGETIWTLDVQAVVTIGKLFLKGVYPNERIIALSGEGINAPQHYKTKYGVCLESNIYDKLSISQEDSRIIDGDVLSGEKKDFGQFFGFYNNNISVIPEVKKKDFLGWILPSCKKESFSRTFFSWLKPNIKFSHNTGYHGGVRAFVASEQYESVFPMDIYPVHLIKSAMYNDMEEMESLGILEVAPEDFALCDFVCVSKIENQYIIRETLNKFHKEG